MSNNNNVDDYKICLTAAGKPRTIISLKQGDTIQNVKRMAQDAFGFSSIVLKAGFPPRPLKEEEQSAREVLSRNERVVVVDGGDENATKKNSKAKSTSTTASSSLQGRAPSKRSAAKAATASFKDVIRAQEELAKEATKKKKTTTRKRARSNNNNAAAARRMASMPGRQLANGNTVGPRPRKNSTTPRMKSQDDVSFALLGALNGGGGGRVGQVLRGAMRNAVANQYETSRAVVRVSAVQSRQYSISLEGGDSLKVSFDKGMEGRGRYEEKVDFVPQDALVAVIEAIYNSSDGGREALRPTNLAQLSPRVFWSVLHHCQQNPNSIEQAMEELVPTLDWSFTTKRIKTLSEKARENLRQQEQPDKQEDLQAAEVAVQNVEQAMEQLHQYDQGRMRENAARAALARQGGLLQRDTTTIWKLVTPTELDQAELEQCVKCDEGSDEEKVKGWIQDLISNGICNWRQLANTDTSRVADIVNLPTNQITPWVDYAQQESVEEIIVEICDNNTRVVEILRDEARSGTPRDLANWRSLPDMLYGEAPSLKDIGISASQLATWCLRAHQVVQEYEWLEWYATPVAS